MSSADCTLFGVLVKYKVDPTKVCANGQVCCGPEATTPTTTTTTTPTTTTTTTTKSPSIAVTTNCKYCMDKGVCLKVTKGVGYTVDTTQYCAYSQECCAKNCVYCMTKATCEQFGALLAYKVDANQYCAGADQVCCSKP